MGYGRLINSLITQKSVRSGRPFATIARISRGTEFRLEQSLEYGQSRAASIQRLQRVLSVENIEAVVCGHFVGGIHHQKLEPQLFRFELETQLRLDRAEYGRGGIGGRGRIGRRTAIFREPQANIYLPANPVWSTVGALRTLLSAEQRIRIGSRKLLILAWPKLCMMSEVTAPGGAIRKPSLS